MKRSHSTSFTRRAYVRRLCISLGLCVTLAIISIGSATAAEDIPASTSGKADFYTKPKVKQIQTMIGNGADIAAAAKKLDQDEAKLSNPNNNSPATQTGTTPAV